MANRLTQLLEQSISGEQVSKEDLSEVVHMVVERRGGKSLYTALHILGHAGNPSHERIVREFVVSCDNAMLARLALQILCNYWGLSNKYVDEIRRFVQGVAWDGDDDIRLAALSIGGNYLHDNEDKALLDAILALFRD